MTVLTTANTVSYVGNGVTTTFDFAFVIPTGALVVTLSDQGKERAAQGYTVHGLDDPNGGRVVFAQAPAKGVTVTLKRSVKVTQEMELVTGAPIYAEVIEGGFDKLTMIAQEHDRENALSLRVPTAEGSVKDMPGVTERANKFLSFAADGAPTVSRLSANEIENSVPAAQAEALRAQTAREGAQRAREGAQAACSATQQARDQARTARDTAQTTAQAVAATLSSLQQDVLTVTSSTTLAGPAGGDLVLVDGSADAVVITLPRASGVGEPWAVNIKKIDQTSHPVIVRTQGDDTLDGTKKDFYIRQTQGGARFSVDLDKNPDDWATLTFGPAVGAVMPLGALVRFDGAVPEGQGYLTADGRQISEKIFPDLYGYYKDRGFPHGGSSRGAVATIARAPGYGIKAYHTIISQAQVDMGKLLSYATAAASKAAAAQVPIGTIIPSAVSKESPRGYLYCDGAVLSRTVYKDLYAAIGTAFGTGGGSTTFAIPDLRGEFLRGWDNGRGADPHRYFGSWQNYDIQSHQHSFNNALSPKYEEPYNLGDGRDGNMIYRGWTNCTGGHETRPRNVAVNFYIKATDDS